MSALYVNTDLTMTLEGVVDVDGNPLTDATVTVTLLEGSTEVTGATWPLTMTHISGGDYQVDLSKDLGLSAGDRITAKFIVAADGKQTQFIHRDVVQNNIL